MRLNFFQNVQNVSPVPQFGIIDPAQNSSNPIKNAYVDYVNTCNWNTTIISNNNPNVKFCAIDGNILFYKSWRVNLELQRCCDGMIYTNDTMVFLEIKDWSIDHDGKTFIESAVEQLENTIVHFCTAHPTNHYSKKYAYISNKARPTFHVPMSNTLQKFKDNTNGYILKVCTQITL